MLTKTEQEKKLQKNKKFGFIALGLVIIIGLSTWNESDEKKAEDLAKSSQPTVQQNFAPQPQFNPSQHSNTFQQAPVNQPHFNNQTAGNNSRYQEISQPQTMSQSTNPQQFMVGNWGLQTQHGTVVAQYMPNGRVMGMYKGNRDRKPTQFSGQWSVKSLGNDRFSLTVAVPGQKPSPNTMRMLPDGNLMNETYKAIAYRMPANQGQGYK